MDFFPERSYFEECGEQSDKSIGTSEHQRIFQGEGTNKTSLVDRSYHGLPTPYTTPPYFYLLSCGEICG
jgi:hypothetical protein